MELLRNGRNFLVRVRSSGGDEGIGVPNAMHMLHVYPVFLKVAPFFVGKDARRLEPLLWELYRHDDNYKFKGLALWVCVAAAEFAILDLLGKKTGKSVGDLLGGVKRREIAVYRASGNRGNTPEAEVEYLKQLVAETGAKALKFRLGGRMSKNADSLPGRTERLIPLVRETFGPEMTLYADSNSSYDAEQAIRIGRLMEAYDYAFYEEPCEFDHLGRDEGGRRRPENPGRRRRAGVQRGSVPLDDHEPGGRHRPARPALLRRLHSLDPRCSDGRCGGHALHARTCRARASAISTPPILASCIPNPTPFNEFKGDADIPVTSETSSLKCENGVVRSRPARGSGSPIDPAFVRKAVKVSP